MANGSQDWSIALYPDQDSVPSDHHPDPAMDSILADLYDAEIPTDYGATHTKESMRKAGDKLYNWIIYGATDNTAATYNLDAAVDRVGEFYDRWDEAAVREEFGSNMLPQVLTYGYKMAIRKLRRKAPHDLGVDRQYTLLSAENRADTISNSAASRAGTELVSKKHANELLGGYQHATGYKNSVRSKQRTSNLLTHIHI